MAAPLISTFDVRCYCLGRWAGRNGREKPQRERLSLMLGGACCSAAFGAAGDEFAACVRGGAEIVAAVVAATGTGDTATAGAAEDEEGETGDGPEGGDHCRQPAGTSDLIRSVRGIISDPRSGVPL